MTAPVSIVEALAASPLADSQRIVVKIGSALLVDARQGAIRRAWLDALIDDLAALRAAGRQVVLVSSGAIAVGRQDLGLTGRVLRLEEKQAAAATGQIRLAHAYQETWHRHGVTVAQILLSIDDTEARRRHLNARATIQQLLDLGAVPVINENDSVATEEIRFGDNDRLGARVAQMISADTLLLLSDIDGLYSGDPKHDPAARHLDRVARITPEIEAMAGSAGSILPRAAWCQAAAAKIAAAAGCRMAILDGKPLNPIAGLMGGARALGSPPPGGRAVPAAVDRRRLERRRHALLDAGAVRALAAGKSLLPAGVARLEEDFARGDLVRLIAPGGEEIGRGLTAYAAADAARIIGHKSREIETILGYRGRDEIIHRLVMAARG